MIKDTGYKVYKHTTPSNKVYIGITKQKPEKRWDNGNGYKNNKHFYRAIQSYEWKNIKHEILENGLTKEQACNKEIELIAKYDSTNPDKGYNHSTGGELRALGVHFSAERRRKISESLKGKKPSAECIRKSIEAHKGKHLSAERRRKISESNKRAYLNPELRRKIGEANKGINSPNYGKHLSAETRRKIGEANKGENSPMYGKHLSAETRWKISESKKGTHLSPETRQRISESGKGKNAKAVICIETGTLYRSGTEAAESIGVTKMAISSVLRGKSKTSGGYHWEYAEDNH